MKVTDGGRCRRVSYKRGLSCFSLQTRIRIKKSTRERHVTVWNIIWDHDAFPYRQSSDRDSMGNRPHHPWHLMPLAGFDPSWVRHLAADVDSSEQGSRLVTGGNPPLCGGGTFRFPFNSFVSREISCKAFGLHQLSARHGLRYGLSD